MQIEITYCSLLGNATLPYHLEKDGRLTPLRHATPDEKRIIQKNAAECRLPLINPSIKK